LPRRLEWSCGNKGRINRRGTVALGYPRLSSHINLRMKIGATNSFWRSADAKLPRDALNGIDEVYQSGSDMGGAGYIFTGEHDATAMRNSATINLNTLKYGRRAGVKKFFYSSSAYMAYMYPEYNPIEP